MVTLYHDYSSFLYFLKHWSLSQHSKGKCRVQPGQTASLSQGSTHIGSTAVHAHIHTFSNLESPVSLMSMSLECVRKLELPAGTRKDPSRSVYLNPGPSHC